MSRTRIASPRWRAESSARLISAIVVVGALAGLFAGGPAPQAEAATTSAVTLKWTGDSSSASDFQPARSTTSPHFDEFKNLSVSVSQTTGLIDQAVRVDVTGFAAGTVSSPDFGKNSMNFMQAMQCWGEDPSAANFRQTCQWGARSGSGNNGLGTSVYADNALRVATVDNNPYNPTTFDNPFRTFDGVTITGKNTFTTAIGSSAQVVKNSLLDILDPTTTNEVTSARINSDGSGSFDFETQSSDQAPQLGCGRDGHTRCWLVLVPRGTIFGGDGAQCSSLLDPNVSTSSSDYPYYSKGRPDSYQGGSPINPKCDYWNNRMVVPLDFVKTGTGCEVGSSETRVIGSQLMVSAMSSWQPDLCLKLKTTYSFSTNSDSVARGQILDGLAPLAFTGLPLSSGELETDLDRSTLAKTSMAYAPVAVSGVVIAFNAEFESGRQEKMNLSPRLVAKLLTQSYRFTVPSSSADPAKNVAHLPAANQAIRFLNQDPEFIALNPTNYLKFNLNPAIVLPGPAGADAIRQVWKWIQADADARAFLNGEVDPLSGMSVNPYYLPLGHPNAVVPTFTEDGQFALDDTGAVITKKVGLTNIDGTPRSLASVATNTFSKDDESKVPLKLTGQRSRFDSLQFAPYTDTLLSGVRQAFRGNPNSKTVWDPTRINSAGEVGDWVSSGIQQPGQKFMITIADGPTTLRYGLSAAALQLPNSTQLATPTEAGMEAGLEAMAPTAIDTVKQVDPAAVEGSGYPLTMVTYAAVNLSETTAANRASISSMLTQITTSGQVSGAALGQLPAGYLPLTAELASRSAQAITAIRDFVAPTSAPNSPQAPVVSSNSSATGAASGGSSVDQLETAADPTVTAGADELSTERTPVSSNSPLANGALVFALIIGLLGLLIGPLLFRGGRFL